LQGDETFLFISTHVYEDKKTFFPGTGRDLADKDLEKDKEKEKDKESEQPTQQEQPRKRRKKEDMAVAIAAAAAAAAAAQDASNILNGMSLSFVCRGTF
jgi:hypothetical protein